MSGHSKWSTIKRQKAVNDNARGQTFSKLSRAITIAVKTGGGPNPDSNYKLKMAIDAARAENMPKGTIDRAINKAASGGEQMEEIMYEGFGEEGVGVLVQATTDNRNRTAQEIKSIFDKNGGTMSQPGSVSFNFELKGYLLIKKFENVDEQILALIDLGIEDVEETEGGIEIYVSAQELFEVKRKVEENGFGVITAELIQKPKLKIPLEENKAEKLFKLLDALDSHEDVQKVFDNSEV